jgi:hypothetical protein
MVFAIAAASSETCSIGFASSRFDRSLAGVFVESELKRHCDGASRRADRAGHCTWCFGRKATERVNAAIFNRGGIVLCGDVGDVLQMTLNIQAEADVALPWTLKVRALYKSTPDYSLPWRTEHATGWRMPRPIVQPELIRCIWCLPPAHACDCASSRSPGSELSRQARHKWYSTRRLA